MANDATFWNISVVSCQSTSSFFLHAISFFFPNSFTQIFGRSVHLLFNEQYQVLQVVSVCHPTALGTVSKTEDKARPHCMLTPSSCCPSCCILGN